MKRVLHTFWESLTGGSRWFPRTIRGINVIFFIAGMAAVVLAIASAKYTFRYHWNVREGETGEFGIDEGSCHYDKHEDALGVLRWTSAGWSFSEYREWQFKLQFHMRRRPLVQWHGLDIAAPGPCVTHRGWSYSLYWLALQLLSIPGIVVAFLLRANAEPSGRRARTRWM